MLIIAILLGALGACAGSFVSALSWRLRNKKDWINGRSQCPDCSHQLKSADLVPILSWLWLRGRCQYCHKPISVRYPLLELAGAANFGLSYYFWPGGLHTSGAKFMLGSWLFISVGLLALAIYDWRWQLLPNKILYPTAVVAILARLIYIEFFAADGSAAFKDWLLAVLVASGLFWLIFQISRGKWIGYGDVRLGLITGSVLATPARSLLMIFLASLLGTAVALPTIFRGSRITNNRIAYGPYLILATAIVLLAGDSAINWYRHFLN